MDFLRDVTMLLCEDTDDTYADVHAIMEAEDNPIRKKTLETLYKSVDSKSHIDFSSIAKSKGDIRKYQGYDNMVEVLGNLSTMGASAQYQDLNSYIQIVQDAITNITGLRTEYMAAFTKKRDEIILEYNTFVYCCIEATTALLYQFVDFLRMPGKETLTVSLKNTKYRADLFFFENLKKFNKIAKTGEYKKYLQAVINNGKENFFGADDALFVGGVAVAATVALSIVPLTRRIIYTVQDVRNKLSKELELQAYFLELNKKVLEANTAKSKEEKEKILKKQEALQLKFTRLADKLRVQSLRDEQFGSNELDKDNAQLTLGDMRSRSSDDSEFGSLL